MTSSICWKTTRKMAIPVKRFPFSRWRVTCSNKQWRIKEQYIDDIIMSRQQCTCCHTAPLITLSRQRDAAPWRPVSLTAREYWWRHTRYRSLSPWIQILLTCRRVSMLPASAMTSYYIARSVSIPQSDDSLRVTDTSFLKSFHRDFCQHFL